MRWNIYKLYLIKVAKWFSLIMPIVVLFYKENNLEQFDIFILQGVYSISIVVLEIPSGYFADVLGRKKSLIWGSLMGFGGFVIYSITHSFYGFLSAEITLGIGQSLISGADSALLYDTLLTRNCEKDYLKYEGRMTSVGNFAEAIAGVLGGFLATISLRTPYFFQTAIAFLAIPASISLIEPARETTLKKMKWKDILNIFHFSIIENKTLRYNILYSSFIGSATLTMAWFVQPYFIKINLPQALYGILWTLLNLSVGLTSLIAFKVENWIRNMTQYLLIAIFIGGLYLLTGIYQSYWAISLLFVFYLIRGIATPILKNSINKHTSSDIRATVLSIRNFIIRLIFAATGPLLGWYTDHYSLATALIMAGIFYLFFSLVILIFARKQLN